MTPCPLVTIPPSASLEDAHFVMVQEMVHHLVVLERKSVVGVISDLDVIQPGTATVGERMAPTVIVVSPATSIHDAARRMLEHRIGALPVVDGDHRLVGILTRRDLLLAVSSFSAARWPGEELLLR